MSKPPKSSKIFPTLNNGDKGRPCEEKNCIEGAYQLSASDKLINTPAESKGIAVYKRTIRYKCANGHRFDKTHTFKKDLLAQESK